MDMSFSNARGVMVWAVLIFGIAVLIFLPGYYFTIKRYLQTTWTTALLATLAAFSLAVAGSGYRAWQLDRAGSFHGPRDKELEIFFNITCAGLIFLFAVPFVINLYQKWVEGKLTEQEKRPGHESLRAWLSAGNIVCALGIAVCASVSYGYAFLGVLAMTLGVVVAYPAFLTLSAPNGTTAIATSGVIPANPGVPPEGLSAERERVLKLLEEGKITADEASELLGALGETVRPAAPIARPMDAGRKLIMFGAAMVLIGFFLPWFRYDLNVEMQRMANKVQSAAESFNPFGGQGGTSRMELKIPQASSMNGNVVTVNGGDIKNGLGWAALILGLVPFVLPLIAANMDDHSRRMATLLALAGGSIILLYLFTQSLRNIHVGVLLVMAGFTLQWLAVLRPANSNAYTAA